MKATRNLCILVVLFLSVGSGIIYSSSDTQTVVESKRDSISIIDQLGIAMRSTIHHLKTAPITMAAVRGIENYRNEPRDCDYSYEASCSWGGDQETTYEASVGVKEYDWYGNYREVNTKHSSHKPSEGTYNAGYDRKKDLSRKDNQKEESRNDQKVKGQDQKGQSQDRKRESWKGENWRGPREENWRWQNQNDDSRKGSNEKGQSWKSQNQKDRDLNEENSGNRWPWAY